MIHGGGEDGQLAACRVAEGKLLVPQLLRRFQHVHRVVGDALEVADGLQQLGGLLALVVAHLPDAELHQIGAQHVLVVVTAALVLPDGGSQLRCVVLQRAQGVLQGEGGLCRHVAGHGAAALQCQ